MNRVLAFVACLTLLCNTANAQKDASDNIAGRINRMGSALRVARVEAANESSELEIVGNQAVQISHLAEEYKAMIKEWATMIEADDQKAALTYMMEKLSPIENRLRTEILLPHQSELLGKMIFADLVKKHQGNLLRSISTNYPNEFELTDEQNEKLMEIELRVKKQVEKAKKRFRDEMIKIENAAKEDAKKTLSPKQLGILKRYNPAKPVR